MDAWHLDLEYEESAEERVTEKLCYEERMMERKPIIAANWKMMGSKKMIDEFMPDFLSGLFPHEQGRQESKAGGKYKKSQPEIVICPPYPYLGQVGSYLKHMSDQLSKSLPEVKLGAQDVYFEEEGPYTGEVSPRMLVDFNCNYVIIGHSERRQLFGETDALIARKFRAAYDASLIPILCVGETEEEHKKGLTQKVIQRQLESVLKAAMASCFQKAVLAYEPVWAIGSGNCASPKQAAEVHAFLRTILEAESKEIAKSVRILYGGSVKPNNAESFFAESEIDGALVGGASLKAKEFLAICSSL